MGRQSLRLPFVPYGSIICDPCLHEVIRNKPYTIYIDLDVCKKIYGEFGSEIYWTLEELQTPPIDIRKIIDWVNVLKIEPFQGQLAQYYQADEEAEHQQVILQRLSGAPGKFICLPFTESVTELEPSEEIIN